MRRLWAVPLGIALSIGLLYSQQTSLTGPVEGYTFDLPTQSFRAVIGLPGSASFGPALTSGFVTGSVAPHKNYAIGFHPGKRRGVAAVGRVPGGESAINTGMLVTGLDSIPVSTRISGLTRQPDAIVWSGDGSVAVLYSRSGAWLQVLSGLPGAPQAAAVVDLSTLGGSLSAVATDQQGQNIALAIQGVNGGVFLSSDGQNFASALTLANPAGLTFSADGASLYILDAGALQLNVFAINDHISQIFALSGLRDPSAIAAGLDARGRPMVYVTGATDQIFQVYDPSSQQVMVSLPLSFQATGIAAFGSNSFVIHSPSQSGDPLWLYVSQPQPSVYFVPAAQSSAGEVN
jgi:hypothetical protein